MDKEEYDWDPNADDVSLIGMEVPIRLVELHYRDEEWYVSAPETAEPDYHCPGYTEFISSDFSHTTTDFNEAAAKVHDFTDRLS
jgi:hypothetical protein